MKPWETNSWSLCSLDDSLHIRKLCWPPEGLTTEILRLFVTDPHLDRQFSLLHVSKDELAAYRYARLHSPEGILLGADDGHRLVGLMSIQPETWASVTIGSHSWSVRELVLARSAPRDTAASLLDAALSFLPEPVEFVSARIPSADVSTIGSMQAAGFNTVCNQALTVCGCLGEFWRSADLADARLLTEDDLQAVGDLSRRCGQFSPLNLEPSLRAWQVNALAYQALVDHIEDPDGDVWVVLSDEGRRMGYVGYRRNSWGAQYAQRDLATIDLFGTLPGNDEHTEAIILRSVLRRMAALGVDGIWSEIPLSGPRSEQVLDAFRSAGFSVTSVVQQMHCWLNRQWRGQVLLPEVRLGQVGLDEEMRVSDSSSMPGQADAALFAGESNRFD